MVGLAEDDLEAAFQVFFVRRGRVLGRSGWVVDRVEDLDRPGLVALVPASSSTWSDRTSRRGCSCPTLPVGRRAPGGVAHRPAGRARADRRARRGARSGKLLEVVARNAADAFQRHKLRRASDFGARSRALAELGRSARARAGAAADRVLRHLEPRADRQGGLDGGVRGRAAQAPGLPEVQDQGSARDRTISPPWTRCSGAGSRGCWRSRNARRRNAGVVLLSAGADRRRRRAGPADAGDARSSPSSGLSIPHIGLAKRLEEVYFPDRPDPLVIPRGSEALFVLQHIRDEAHRSAVTYHRTHREKRALHSPLDDIPGVGPSRKKALLKRFGSLTQAPGGHAPRRSPTRPGSGPELAATISRAAARRADRPAGERVSDADDGRVTRVHDHHRALGRRPVGGRALPRGPRVLRRRQPAAGAAAEDGRARRCDPGGAEPGRDRGRRPRRRVLRRAVEGARGAPQKLIATARIVFLEASDDDLVSRYEATRRRHPLAPADRVVEGIRKERQILAQLRGEADLVIDTSGLTPHELRDRVRDAFADAPPEDGLQVSVVSFGFKYGAPRDADLAVRRPVPAEPALGPGAPAAPGHRPDVREYVRGSELYATSSSGSSALLDVIAPRLRRRGQELPHDRDRLHRRASPLGRRGRGARELDPRHAACRSSLVHRDLERG